MKENMKYIYEEGKFINEYKIIKKINEGLIAGAVALMCYRLAMRRITRNY